LTGEAGNASRRKVIVEATARSLEWASAWRTQDESGPTFSRVIRTNFGDRMAKIFRENSDSLGALNTILDINARFSINDRDRFIALSQLTFDLSVYDIFGCFAVGGALEIPDADYVQNLQHWEILLFQNKVSVWNSVPALMDIFVEYLEKRYPSVMPEHALRLVLLSGDWIPLKLPEKIRRVFGEEIAVISLGGATEASIWSILYPIKKVHAEWKSIPYGKAMKNQSFHILDKRLNPLIPGEIGELFIGGLGVAEGYWRDIERTSAQFIQHPTLGRLYRTGDLGRYLIDGNIEFLGRVDFQVKIAGYRVEINAIEKYLLDFPNVEQAIVLPYSEGRHQKLAAYLVLNRNKYLEGNSNLEHEQVSYWQKIYDDLYSNSRGLSYNEDPTSHTAGWIGSAKYKKISVTHMHEWVENTVKRILNLQAKSIFEIGCGTGLLLFRLAPYVQTYEAIDFSKKTVECVQEQLKKLAIKNVHLYVGEAKNIHKFNKTYDLVILNSVIQYFPSVNHLIGVLNKSIDKVKEKGYVFIGDIRSLSHLRAFYSAILLEQQPHLSDEREWKLLLDDLIEKEDELVVDSDFFYSFQKINSRVSHVEILIKEGQFQNEMNCFRYDIILYIDHPINSVNESLVWQDWGIQTADFEQLHTDLLKKENNYLAIKNIPNKRTIGLQKIANYGIDSEDTIKSLSILKQRQVAAQDYALDPNVFLDLASHYNFLITVKWSDKNPVEFFDVIISKSVCKDYLTIFNNENTTNKSLNSYANLPILSRINKALISNIRVFLKAYLPWYMMPSYFAIMQQLPINANGKIDRKNLTKIFDSFFQKDVELSTTPIQKKLLEIWKELLNIPTLGIHDAFMEVGGTSLLAVQLIGDIHINFGVTIHIQAILLDVTTIAQLSLLIDKKLGNAL
jgi:2-polyprenyl-3-methyl-5-hydroxy-6-metoxy-1,4-benzoquinol methylase/acyl carrier protein